MAVLSDLLVAPEQQTNAVLISQRPAKQWTAAEWKGLSEINFEQLWAILDKRPYDLSRLKQFKTLTKSADGPWVIVFPHQLTRQIAGLPKEALASISKAWAASEEFRLDKLPEPDVFILLSDVHRLAVLAVKEKKALMLWVSL